MLSLDPTLTEGSEHLRAGQVIVYPTETAYGLGCDATNACAVQRLMAIKGREGSKTPPLIADCLEMVEQHVLLTPKLKALAQRFWPGDLTVVASVRADSALCAEVVRDGTVAMRVSSHPVAVQLARTLGYPLVATSANRAGQPMCYRMEDIRQQFAVALLQPDYFLDGGVLKKRKPSTIVVEQEGELVVLRQGEIEIPQDFYVA